MYFYSNVSAGLLFVQSEQPLRAYAVFDSAGTQVDCPLLTMKPTDGGFLATLDVSALQPWSVENPALYTMKTEGKSVRFGHSSLQPMQNRCVLLNGSPVYLRGYIRGIIVPLSAPL